MVTDLVSYENNCDISSIATLLRSVSGADDNDRANYAQSTHESAREDCGSMNAEELLALMERHALEKDGWTRSMGATIALLRYAHLMIEKAETTIATQEKRLAQLEDLVTTDELTGLRNRRGFYEVFVAELDRCERGLSHGGLLVLIDMDNFKMINDTYGHLAGDACLRLVARTLASEVRVMDIAARLGGDEFVLLLSNTTKKKAASRAQQLAWRLNNLALAWYGDVIPVRASLGLKAYSKGDRPEAIFGAADSKLYDSKARRKAAVKGKARTG